LTKSLEGLIVGKRKKQSTKAVTKRSTHCPLIERAAVPTGMLKGRLKEVMRKVASKPEA
jgi:hypothetical protein